MLLLLCLATMVLFGGAATNAVVNINGLYHGVSSYGQNNVFAHPVKGSLDELRLRGGSGNLSPNSANNSLNSNEVQNHVLQDRIAQLEHALELARNKAALAAQGEIVARQGELAARNKAALAAQGEIAARNEAARAAAMQAGKFFASFDSLAYYEKEIVRPSNLCNTAILDEIRNSDTLLKWYWPPQCPLYKGPHSRIANLDGCRFDLLNQPLHDRCPCPGAHVMGFARSCNRHWEKFIRFRLNVDKKNMTKAHKKEFDMFLYGYVRTQVPAEKEDNADVAMRADPIVCNSGYLHSALNCICLRNQAWSFDKYPCFLWLPLHRTAKQLWNFQSDDALEYIIICSDAQRYQDIGAASSPFNETSWISCTDDAVTNAFRVFGEVLSVVIGVVSDDDHSRATEADNVKNLRTYFQNESVTTFEAPCVKEGYEGYFLKVKLNRPRCCRPGRHLESWDLFDGHPSPDPINLMCRSYSSFLTYLLDLPGNGFRKKSVGTELCKLFPSCLDTSGANECTLCHASELLHDLYRAPFLSTEYRYELLDIISFRRC